MPYTRKTRTKRRPTLRRQAQSRMPRHAILYNPFSVSAQPKIHDGKSFRSLGRKMTQAGEWTLGKPTATFLFSPGFNCPLACDGANYQAFSEFYRGHLQRRIVPLTTQHKYTANTSDYNVMKQDTANLIERWRYVSAGLRLQLTNNTDSNDGWFECARVELPCDYDNFRIVNMADPFFVDPESPGTEFNPVFVMKAFDQTVDISNLPSYMTGKLRDISKYRFQLKPNTNDLDFIKIPPSEEGEYLKISTPDVVEGEGTGGDPSTGTLTEGLGHKAKQNNIDMERVGQYFDRNFDCMLIRVHGRGWASGNTPTKLLSHIACNMEFDYCNGAILAPYQTLNSKLDMEQKTFLTEVIQRVEDVVDIGEGTSPPQLDGEISDVTITSPFSPLFDRIQAEARFRNRERKSRAKSPKGRTPNKSHTQRKGKKLFP